MAKRIPSWSFSRLQVFETCKYRAALQWRDKIADLQPKTAADRGTAMHQEAEDYVCGKSEFTHNLRFFKNDFAALATHYNEGRVVCEEEWAFSRDWRNADWKTGWLRLKCDAVCFLDPTHAVVIDYKSGKRFGNEVKHAEQLQLYALCALLRYPNVEQVTCELWYLDQNELASFKMKRSQIGKYLALFDRRGRAFTEEEVFKPSANIHACKYCPYSPDKQGECEYGVDQNGMKAGATKPVVKPVEFKPLTPELEKKFSRFL
jgi:hypothetical protein